MDKQKYNNYPLYSHSYSGNCRFVCRKALFKQRQKLGV